ncbi:MAG: hypothetical protein EBY49_08375, partial [Actinobacteria bacterium]|nr:hypothetical protein [Actinomycetota bacterium]
MHKILMTITALALVAAACGGGGGDDETTAEATTTTEAAATTTEAPATTTSTTSTTTTTTTTEPPLAWRQVLAGDDCVCSDGSDYSYWVREGDPSKVMLFFDGGGRVLYVGKARILRQRLASYFASWSTIPERNRAMLESARSVE